VSRGHPFQTALADQLPGLRAFARSLARDPTLADDLTQETLLKAWAARERFSEGTNLRAWLFTILRNVYYSRLRKRRREVEDADGAHAARLAVAPDQEHVLTLADVNAAIGTLPAEQREALVLVGAAGLSYEEAAEICGCAVGTVKSRVNRARARVARILGLEEGESVTGDKRMHSALAGALAPYAA
jgi:RNA polymerase sigma-70 factor (ECF subfamily)